MAKLTKWALFWRAFFLTAVFGGSASAQNSDESEVWEQAVAAGSADGYYFYLSLYPAGAFVDDAVRALIDIGALDSSGVETRGFNAPAPAGGYQ